MLPVLIRGKEIVNMAYTMTHVLVGERVLEYFDFPMDYSTYMAGAVAPDAVHARESAVPHLQPLAE